MNILDYIDYREIYNKVKKNQLEEYPTANDYIEQLESCDEPYEYVEEMYRAFELDFNEYDTPTSDEMDDSIIISYLNKSQFFIEFSIGGNDANESTNYNYWGYGHQFIVDLEDDGLFVGYSLENYS